MIALRDAGWEVTIFQNGKYYIWFASSPNDYGGVFELSGGANFESKKGVKKHWEEFARVNKIKKWRYT